MLALPAGDHQASAHNHQNDAQGGRNSFIVVGSNSDMRIAQSHAVMLRMRKRNEERNYTQHQHYNSNQHQRFQRDAS